ncbi:39S ribosomal protein L34, mitochondrial [Orchesella cincta]|uniref:Large ribosomal subunit protein bL34m n=1 Tax=Orchesella cincta TaxID=48709 RepID=A0A1D2NE72_ORCCI|nr:39S ribosomal protein L34, mitochondrial [Orchesella cincta]
MQILRACVNAVRGGIFNPQPAFSVGQARSIGTTAQGIFNGSCCSSSVATPTKLSSLLSPAFSGGSSFLQGHLPAVNFARSIIIITFPRPRENKRINVCGFKKRMATPSGRRVLMRRILKGRHSLSH